MEERQVQQQYCQVCGIDVKADAELKRFGKFFCSKDHIEQYVRAKQQELGIEERSTQTRRRERRFFGGC